MKMQTTETRLKPSPMMPMIGTPPKPGETSDAPRMQHPRMKAEPPFHLAFHLIEG